MKIHIDISEHPLVSTIGSNGNKLGQKKARMYWEETLRALVRGESRDFGELAAALWEPHMERQRRKLDALIADGKHGEAQEPMAELAEVGAVQQFFRSMGTLDSETCAEVMADHERQEGPPSQ